MEQSYKNLDCRNYAPVDVAKGMCQRRKVLVLGDADACDMFSRLPKCKHCAEYRLAEEAYLGACAASPAQPMTYPDLSGVTCVWFSWKEAA